MIRISLVFVKKEAVSDKKRPQCFNGRESFSFFLSDIVRTLKSLWTLALVRQNHWSCVALLSKDRLTIVEKFICPDEKRAWAKPVRLLCSIGEIEEAVQGNCE